MTTLTISQQEQAYRDVLKYNDIQIRMQDLFPDDSYEEIEAKVVEYLRQNP